MATGHTSLRNLWGVGPAKVGLVAGGLPPSSAISAASAAAGHIFLGRSLADEFIERGAGGFGPQHAPQPLDVLARGSVAADDHRDPAVRNVYPLIQHAPGHELGEASRPESLQNQPALLCRRSVGDLWDGEALANLGDELDLLGRDRSAMGKIA